MSVLNNTRRNSTSPITPNPTGTRVYTGASSHMPITADEHNDSRMTPLKMIEAELTRIASISIGGGSNLRTPIGIILDLSQSMDKHISTLKRLLKYMHTELSVVNERDYTLIIVGIYNSQVKILYFGDLHDNLNIDAFIASIPDHGAGRTPLATAFEKADKVLEQLTNILEAKEHYYTIPLFFSITDSASTEQNVSTIVDKFKQDIRENRKIVVEFITRTNPDGLSLGGYQVNIDTPNNEAVISGFMKAVRLATASVINRYGFASQPPTRHDRKAYNASMSNTMLTNFRYHYDEWRNQ